MACTPAPGLRRASRRGVREHGVDQVLTEDRDFSRFQGIVPVRLAS